MARLYLLLGGNQGDRKNVLASAQEMLENKLGSIERTSSMYETEPWGFESESQFLNQLLEIRTDKSPEEVLSISQIIEDVLGRDRAEDQWADRIIDIDILLYDDLVITTEELTIPHLRLHQRKFALAPLNELAPDLIHPLLQRSVRELYEDCQDGQGVVALEE